MLRSLIVLKALTHEVTGALVAAPTTSLPEDIGGVRNWDYRYSWLRDSALTLIALFGDGYVEEAIAYRDTLPGRLGRPVRIQIMYGVGGERRLTEFEVDELPGYEGSGPCGSATPPPSSSSSTSTASWRWRSPSPGHDGSPAGPQSARSQIEWPRWIALIDHVESVWREPDDGIWEVRGPGATSPRRR